MIEVAHYHRDPNGELNEARMARTIHDFVRDNIPPDSFPEITIIDGDRPDSANEPFIYFPQATGSTVITSGDDVLQPKPVLRYDIHRNGDGFELALSQNKPDNGNGYGVHPSLRDLKVVYQAPAGSLVAA